ncbi:response regulator transcription factor [Portibacter lacus]|uniref:DNA-binding response regulator n=1 Tax=Portibacter lacus TaxID=1099794 RepID=A0AA37WCD7_9BACT|nr:response regulator transcription factor [Portibacter lacus]GLR16376.1 DNA-binding response regulator [Portibacter lacus]
MEKRILLVEDEITIQKVVKMNLELEGYEVIVSANGKDALELAKNQYFDLIVLDIMLPEVNGFEICEQVRLNNKEIGIIIVSAKDNAEDRVLGLKMGADDYLAKPFNLEELLLRVEKLISRRTKTERATSEVYQFGDNRINFSSYEAHGNGKDLVLTKKEAQLLQLLIERKNEAVSREQILKTVWGYDVFPATRTIDNFLLSFRKYFEKDPKNPEFFKSVRGIGYKFTDK